MTDAVLRQDIALPVGTIGRSGLGWWGVLCAIATEGALFAFLLFSYLYVAVQAESGWRQGLPSLRFALPLTVVAIASSLILGWTTRQIARGAQRPLLGGLALALLLGLAFVVLELLEWRSEPFSPQSGVYGSLFFIITGTHLVHVVAGVLALAVVLVWAALGYFDARRHAPVLITATYWHFVNLVWLVFFAALYLSPYLE